MKITKKFILLPASALLFSGCVERGYQLTVQPSTHTATAQISMDITSEKSQKSTETYKKMKRAVKRALKKHEDTNVKPTSSLQNNHEKSYHSTQIKTKAPHVPSPSIAHQPPIHEEKELPTEKENTSVSIEKKIPLEEESTKASNNDKKISLEQEIALSLSEKEKKESTINQEEKKPLQAKEKVVQKNTMEKHPSISVENKEDKQASTTQSKIPPKNTPSIKPKETVNLIQDSHKQTIRGNHYQSTDRSILFQILFQHIDKTYYKFGTSEIHGRIVYLDKNGNEISPRNIKVYLLPQSATLDHWYKSYYLKNKTPSKQIKFGYIHKTYPNIEKSFGFYGVPEGKYYVIILADDPKKQNSKIYIAKKLNIGKYKKVMAVFSKRL